VGAPLTEAAIRKLRDMITSGRYPSGAKLPPEPELAADVVFGLQATEFLEGRFGAHLLSSWRAGRSSLRQPLSLG